MKRLIAMARMFLSLMHVTPPIRTESTCGVLQKTLFWPALANCYVNVLSSSDMSTPLDVFFINLFQPLFLSSGCFYRFIVRLDDIGFVDYAGESHVIGIFHNWNTDSDEFLYDLKPAVEVGFLS